MLFTSYEFLAFILILFILYYLIPAKAQWKLLLLASYLFYFLASPIYVVYIFTTTVTIYFASCRIGKIGEEQSAYLKAHKSDLSKDERKE